MKTLLTIDIIYYIIGIIVLFIAFLSLKDKKNPKRYKTAFFWSLFSIIFLFSDLAIYYIGKSLTYRIIGILVILMALIAGLGQFSNRNDLQKSIREKKTYAIKFGNKVFIPALLIPILTVTCTFIFKDLSFKNYFFFDQKNLTLASLTFACFLSLIVGLKLTGGNPLQAINESKRLLDSIGWAAILPMMLAMLGGIFTAAQTGNSIQEIAKLIVDPNNRFLLVAIYCVGMALFSIIMGNAFAAFPVMTAGVALPFLVHAHNANPIPLVAIGMYSGYCGTLMTPMAANFNIVPAALLELRDKYGVIKVQIPTAISMLIINIFLMYFIIFI
ncbi:DUF979 domain-containing protein [Fluviispira vulneris]|uniref:DUF979 domain-containing protein n=1 Tax=Fluviispira vulneris TaxID=2763012 RepID=UPI001645EB7E|nr:DUF979 domain-containing protein [Fluviispira vulneris]